MREESLLFAIYALHGVLGTHLLILTLTRPLSYMTIKLYVLITYEAFVIIRSQSVHLGLQFYCYGCCEIGPFFNTYPFRDGDVRLKISCEMAARWLLLVGGRALLQKAGAS